MEINNVDSLVNRLCDQKLSSPFLYTRPRPLRCQLLTNCPCYTNNILFISGTSFILLVLGLWPFQTLTRTLSVPRIWSSFIITVSVLSQRLLIQYVVYPSNIWLLYQLCQPSKFKFNIVHVSFTWLTQEMTKVNLSSTLGLTVTSIYCLWFYPKIFLFSRSSFII